MIKCEVIEEFTLKEFDKLQNVERFDNEKKEKGKLYLKDKFECEKDMAEYLTGKNVLNKTVVKIVEVMPIENKKEVKEIKRKKKSNKKK